MALRSTPTLRFSVFGGMTAVMLVGVALAFWPFHAANRAMEDFCAAQVPGTPAAQVQAQAEARSYLVAAPASSALLVDDPLGFGRRQCMLALDAQGRVAPPR